MTDETAPIQDDQTKADRGPSVLLGSAPKGYKIDRTFLIDISDPSPDRLVASMKYFDTHVADDGKIVGHYEAASLRRTLGTAVFAGMLGVTLFGIFLTPVFFYVVRRFTRQSAQDNVSDESPYLDRN